MSIQQNLSDELERLLATVDIGARAESVYHWLHEQALDAEEKAYILDRLLPRRERYATPNDEIITDDFIEDFTLYRSMGMSLKDTAAMLCLTTKRLNDILSGHGISPEKHERLLRRNLQAGAICKFVHLKTVTDASKAGDWKAALAILERKFPDEFGLKQKISTDVNANVNLGTAECESRALEAQRQLKEIRDKRKEAENES